MSDFLDRLLAQSRPVAGRPAVAPRLPGRFEGQAGEGFKEVEALQASDPLAEPAGVYPAPARGSPAEPAPTLAAPPGRAPPEPARSAAPVILRTESPLPEPVPPAFPPVDREAAVQARSEPLESPPAEAVAAAPPPVVTPVAASPPTPPVERRIERVEHVVETRLEAMPVEPYSRAPEPLRPAPLAPVLPAAVAPPPPAAARPAPAPAPAPVVRVHIGRIEIQAAADPFADMRRPAREVASPPSALQRHLRGG